MRCIYTYTYSGSEVLELNSTFLVGFLVAEKAHIRANKFSRAAHVDSGLRGSSLQTTVGNGQVFWNEDILPFVRPTRLKNKENISFIFFYVFPIICPNKVRANKYQNELCWDFLLRRRQMITRYCITCLYYIWCLAIKITWYLQLDFFS